MEKLNSSQLSRAFQVSKVTVKNWVDRGCPHTKTDKGNEFILSDVIKWHRERFVKAGVSDELQKSRALKEHWKALLSELEFKERSGELVPAKAVEEAAFNKARQARDALLAIPSRISDILAGEINKDGRIDKVKVNEILTKEIRQCLEAIAGDLRTEVKNERKD